MHDYFEILGLPTNARASEVRRAHARRVHLTHPDFRDPVVGMTVTSEKELADASCADAAIDFIDASTLLERMQAAFFTNGEASKA